MSDATPLLFVPPTAAPQTFNVLLYGAPKNGKSTAASTAPGPILWVNAEGSGALAFARKQASLRGAEILEVRVDRDAGDGEPGNIRETLREVIRHVRAGTEPKPQTVVVDTIGKIREGLAHKIVDQGSSKSMKQWQEVTRIVREFVRALRDASVNLVLIAHQEVQDADDDRIVRPQIGGVLTEEIAGEVDVLAYCTIFTDSDGVVSYVGQLREGKGRVAGDRSGGLGPVRALDLSEWLATYQEALTPDDSDLPFSLKEGDPEPQDADDDGQQELAAA